MEFLNSIWSAFVSFVFDIAFMLTIIFLVIAFVFAKAFLWKKKVFSEWKDSEGKGSIASAALGIVSIIGMSFFAALVVFLVSGSSNANANRYSDMFIDGSWNNGVYTFIGVDYTRGVSPQCKKGGADDKATSNMGIGWQSWRSLNKRHELDVQFTHHSCVIGKDTNGYDGLGGKYVYWIFRK